MAAVLQVSGEVVGQARMQRYLRDCGGDRHKAHALFEWHLEAAGEFHRSLHLFEVIVRNAMDRELKVWNAAQGFGPDWLLTPDPRLNKVLDQKTLNKARSRAGQVASSAGRALLHDDVLAQMTFGTWRYLLPSNSSVPKQRLWTDALSASFPGWGSPWPTLVDRFAAIHEFRNRVAHLEPIHAQRLRYVRRSMRHITRSVDYRAWRIYANADRTAPLGAKLALILP